MNNRNDIITVIVDPKYPLGKRIDAQGRKSSNVRVSRAHAVQRHVESPEVMAKLLEEVAKHPRAAILNCSFPGIPVDQDFLILSSPEMMRRLGRTKREEILGVHHLTEDGRDYMAVCRLKENVYPSSWQLLDRDIDEYTPPQFAKLTTEEWLAELSTVMPGLSDVAKVCVPSASSRIRKNNKTVGKLNIHVWIQVEDPEDVERVRPILLLRAMEQGKAWQKPRKSRLNDEVVGHSNVALLDHSVWTPGRLAFEGMPTVSSPYTVAPLKAKVFPGIRLDTSLIPTPERDLVQRISASVGTPCRLREGSGAALVLDSADLTFDTQLELESGETLTVRDAMQRLPSLGKIRCQAPFRESSSFAAFLSQNKSGKPFVHDTGTGTNHWLNDTESLELGYAPFYKLAPNIEDVLQQCERMDPKLLDTKFADLVVHLSVAERERVLRLVKDRTGSSLHFLKAQIKDAMTRARAAAIDRQVGQRTAITFMPADITKMSEMTEQAIAAVTPIEEYLVFGGHLAQVTLKSSVVPISPGSPSSSVPAIEILDEVGARQLIERNVVFQAGDGGKTNLIEVPKKIIDTIIGKKVHAAPTVRGLLLHPTVFLDGTIWAGPGYHKDSGLLYAGHQFGDMTPYKKGEAKKALQRLRNGFLDGFEFASPLDADSALASLFTGVVRRTLPQAPGFGYVAPMPSSGKSTLAYLVNLMLTGQSLETSIFPEGNPEEMTKILLAQLRSNPEMICYDNLTEGMTFSSGALAQALTSIIFQGRLLNHSQTMSCATNVLFVFTGNNIQLGSDETSRWILCRLDSKSPRPHERQFMNADVMAHGLAIRAQVLRDVVGIIGGFLKYGKRQPPKTRFPMWDQMVRQPLMWAGGSDLAVAFKANAEKSPSINAALAAVLALREYFNGQAFTAFQVASAFGGNPIMPPALLRLGGALSDLRARTLTSANSVGRALGSITDRPVEHEGILLTLRRKTVNGTEHYYAEAV